MSTDDANSGRRSKRNSLTPAQSRILSDAVLGIAGSMRFQPQMPVVPSLFQESVRMQLKIPAFEAFQAIAQPILPQVEIANSLASLLPNHKFDLSPLTLDYPKLFGPAVNFENLGFGKLLDKKGISLFNEIFESQRTQFQSIFESFSKLADGMYPPNMRHVEGVTFEKIEEIVLDEGLALAWVPDRRTVELLFAADNKAERRKIIGRRWKTATAACRSVLDEIDSEELSKYTQFAEKSLHALETGQPEAAQALSANLLDTILRETLNGSDRKMVTDQRQRLDLDELPFRSSIVLGGIWGSHTQFWQNRGDKIPRAFSRHASAHGVSPRQYSRVNSVIALMHVVSLLKLIDSGDLA